MFITLDLCLLKCFGGGIHHTKILRPKEHAPMTIAKPKSGEALGDLVSFLGSEK